VTTPVLVGPAEFGVGLADPQLSQWHDDTRLMMPSHRRCTAIVI